VLATYALAAHMSGIVLRKVEMEEVCNVPDRDLWRRRQAVQLAAQLPEDPQDALAVLAHVKFLVETFLAPREREETQAASPVVPFRAR
jgi:hypothetical protein